MPGGQEGDFFDTHLSNLLTPPSFIQAGPNLLQKSPPEADKPDGHHAPQPASFWRFGNEAEERSHGISPLGGFGELDVHRMPDMQAEVEAHQYSEGRSSRDAYGQPPVQESSRDARSRAHSLRASTTAHPVEPLVEMWHVEDHERSPRGSASQAFCGLPLGCKTCTSGQSKKCCRCKQLGTSCFDHTCPKCKVMVCLACLDDFRMILTTFRCPKCGEEAENRAALQHEIWMINIYRSAERVFSTVGTVAKHVFTSGSTSSTPPVAGGGGRASMQKLAPGEVRPRGPAAEDLAPAVPEHSTRLPANWYPAARGPMEKMGAGPSACGRNMSPPPPQEDAAVPEHHTRLPVNWQAIMAAGGLGCLHRRGLPSSPWAEYHTFSPVRAMK
mmetsp:Transcript_126529/g.316285  ORF Transcript_126529/g.316285 Transcript_126529/m.316285 type:complete len:385 (-) Transcript_126529:86-1240(-)